MKTIVKITRLPLLIGLALFFSSCPKESKQEKTNQEQAREKGNEGQNSLAAQQVPCGEDRTEVFQNICALNEADAKAEAERNFKTLYECDPACTASSLLSTARATGTCIFQMEPAKDGTMYEVTVELKCR
jgi:hypothetical protein